MAAAQFARHSGDTRPPLGGAIAYLLLNLPVGITGFVTLVTLGAVGVSTAIVWVGVPVGALAVLLARGGAQIERARIYALLDAFIPQPYRPLPPTGQSQRWKARLSDSATWRDVSYFLLLFPLGITQFVLVVTLWAVSLGMLALPIYYRFLPDGAYFFPAYDVRWITVDSELTALPWAVLGVLLLAVAAAFTRALASWHARFARLLLGPSAGRMREAEADVSAPVATRPVAG